MKAIRDISCFLLFFVISSHNITGSESLFPLKINNRYGFINNQGQLIIDSVFEFAQPFSDDRALIQKDGKYGFINTRGEVIFYVEGIASRQWIHSFSDGLAAVKTNNRQWGFVDKNGNFAIPSQFYHVRDFTEGIAAVKKNATSMYIYIDKTGREVFPGQTFKVAHQKSGGYMVVGQQIYEDTWIEGQHEGERINISGVRYGVINSEGDTVIPITEITHDTEVSNGYFKCSRGFVDMQNRVIIDHFFQISGRFYDGVIPISSDGMKFGLIDKDGKYVVREIFDHIQTFSSGYGVFVQEGKYGFINTTGNVVIEPLFDFAMAFRGELAFIRINGIDGYITKTGKLYLSSSY
ncbi:MAG: WG repeat-containing protein [Prevotellaceae bacterium]|jgi:hypothetical protein|nr:WG repeat-containing protein [Prevotellaceae bacterium]